MLEAVAVRGVALVLTLQADRAQGIRLQLAQLKGLMAGPLIARLTALAVAVAVLEEQGKTQLQKQVSLVEAVSEA
jgi:hypothetical protein